MDSDSRTTKITFITLVQIIAMMLIVLSRSLQIKQTVPSFVLNLIPHLQQIGLTVFMSASGFLVIRTKSIERYGYLKFVQKRFIRLMVPYFVVQLLILFPKCLLSRLSGEGIDLAPVSILKSFVYPREGILPHLWFLPTLMILSLISPLLIKLLRNTWSCIFLCIAAVFLNQLSLDSNLLCFSDVRKFLLWYMFGMIIGYYVHQTKESRFLLLFFSIVCALGYVLLSSMFQPNRYIQIVMGILSLGCLGSASKLVGDKSIKICDAVGKYTFTIYILSLPIQNVVEILSGRLSIIWPVTVICMFVFGIVIPMAI